jgi:hypothetical protein
MVAAERNIDGLAGRVEYLERRDRRQVRTIAALIAAVVLLGLTVGWLARSLDTRNDAVSALTVLVERQECTDVSEARFEDAVTEVLVAADSGDGERLAAAIDDLEALGPQVEAIERCPDG